MADVRRIKKVWKAKPTVEGAGVRLKRVFGNHEVPQLDPFLLLDDFRSNDAAEYVRGFPWHPHRGIETITYVLAGDVEHGDSLGNRGVISSGDVQGMKAGHTVFAYSSRARAISTRSATPTRARTWASATSTWSGRACAVTAPWCSTAPATRSRSRRRSARSASSWSADDRSGSPSRGTA